MFGSVEWLETVDSTNEYLKQYIPSGAAHAVAAGEQTAGKGRYGRSWHSPPGNLFVSYLFFPDWPAEKSAFLNYSASIAIQRSIRSFLGSDSASRVWIKEPNDVLVEGRKIAGVLVELASLQGRLDWSIVGLGVNLHSVQFPIELRGKVTSLLLEAGRAPRPRDFCDSVTSELIKVIKRLDRGQWSAVQREYEEEAREHL